MDKKVSGLEKRKIQFSQLFSRELSTQRAPSVIITIMDTEKLAEIRARDAQTKKNQEDEQRHQELISNFNALGKSYMSGMQILVDFLTGVTTKTEVTNQLESISTPDVDKVVVAVGELKKSFDEKNVDLSPVIDALSDTNKYLQKLPTEFPEAKEVESIDLTPINEILGRIETAISSLNLIAEAPVINVPKAPTPNVHVDAPDMSILLKPLESLYSAFKELKMPDYEPTDVSGLQKQLEKANEHLAKLVKKPVGGGGGGGGGYVFKMPNDGPMVAPELEADGSVPVTIKNPGDISGGGGTSTRWALYADARQDLSGDPMYFGKEDADGNWVIKRFGITSTETKYFEGTGGISSNWADRATYVYQEFKDLT